MFGAPVTVFLFFSLQAESLAEEGKREAAMASYGWAIRAFPWEGTAFNGRALLRLEEGDHDGALEDADKAIRLDSSSENHFTRGRVLFELSRLEEAIHEFTAGIPAERGASLFNRGLCYGLLGKDEKAAQDFSNCIELSPNDEAAYLERGRAYASLGETEKSVADFGVVLRLKPENAEALRLRSLVRRVGGDLDGAIEDATELIRLQGDQPMGFYERALAEVDNGDLLGAIADLSQAIALDPNEPDYWRERAKARRQNGDTDGAAEDEGKAQKLEQTR